MSPSSGHSGLPTEVQRAIEYAGALAGQYAQSQASDRLESLKGLLIKQFADAYAAPLRARNASVPCSLPNELWIATWSMLDLREVLNVSHVSHGWRLLAVSTPSLWTSVALICTFRVPDNAASHCAMCMYSSIQTDTYATNIKWAHYLLSRTQSLPLSICVTTSEFMDSSEYGAEISDFLQVYHLRIARLDVRCASGGFFSAMLCPSLSLPSLRELTLADNGVNSGVADGIFYEPVDFPSLETLGISPSFRWGSTSGVQFPSLRKLLLCVDDSSDLEAALAACPALRQLHIISQLDPGDTDQGSWDLELGPDLRRISTVSIELSGVADEYGIAEIFEHAPGTDLILTFPYSIPHRPALRLLQSLSKPIRVSFTITEARRVTAVFADNSRKLSFVWRHDVPVQPVFSPLPPASVAAVESDAELWPGVLDSLPDIGGIEELNLRLHSTEDFHLISQKTSEDLIFPSISTLRIHGQCPGIVADVRGVIALVDQFNLGKRLRALEVKRARVEGCLPELSSLADDLRLG